jgi:hypothetical protein
MIASDKRARLGALALLAWVASMVVGLVVAFQEPLFFGSGHRSGQGIDFFCVPKAFLNLLAGQSAFDTWGGERLGPHATWFVLHPAVALWLGAYFSWLPAWWAYGAWAAASLLGLGWCGLLLASHVSTPARKVLAFAALLASPITYALLFCGNVHGVIAVAVALVLAGLHELASGARPVAGISPRLKVSLGLLLSLLCKPVLILVAPALLITRATRSAALGSLGAYSVISLTFLLVPALNPEAVGLERLVWLLLHPGWVKVELDVYAQRFVLIPEMLDNAMHWLHMVAQSDNAFDHVQVFSLPVTVRAFFPVSTGVFRWLALLPVVASPLLLRLGEARRPIATAWLVVLALASHFLGYAVAWEYQYSQLLVVAAALLSLSTLRETSPRWLRVALAGLALLYVPTPYLLLKANGFSPGDLLWMRAFRVGPAVLTAVAALGAFVQIMRSATPPETPRQDVEVAPIRHGLPVLGAARARAFAGLLLAPVAVLVATRWFVDDAANASRLEHLINQSRTLLDTRQARASLVPLERARRLAPDTFAVQNNLCVAYGMLERKQEALESCRRAVAIQPESGRARNNLAWVETLSR